MAHRALRQTLREALDHHALGLQDAAGAGLGRFRFALDLARTHLRGAVENRSIPARLSREIPHQNPDLPVRGRQAGRDPPTGQIQGRQLDQTRDDTRGQYEQLQERSLIERQEQKGFAGLPRYWGP